MRACKQTPSESDLDAIYTKYNLDNDDDTYDLSTFTKIMENESKSKPSNEEQELRDQFKVFDRNDDGNIGVSEFRYIMTNLGEKMSDDEINELLQDPTLVDAKTGLIQYEKLIKIILGPC
jgi:Ca2+-binding EF-hand superfamily protein